jgi:predicted RNA-binding Zn-ribbon protein involved in translation (DUF1610 family)
MSTNETMPESTSRERQTADLAPGFTCPDCEETTVNGQGLYTCLDCGWDGLSATVAEGAAFDQPVFRL